MVGERRCSRLFCLARREIERSAGLVLMMISGAAATATWPTRRASTNDCVSRGRLHQATRPTINCQYDITHVDGRVVLRII